MASGRPKQHRIAAGTRRKQAKSGGLDRRARGTGTLGCCAVLQPVSYWPWRWRRGSLSQPMRLATGMLAAVKSGITLRGTPIASETRAPSAGSPNSAASARPAAASTPSASPVTQRQAAANLAVLLGQSGRERRAVSAAFSDAAQCGPALSQDAETFQAAAACHTVSS